MNLRFRTRPFTPDSPYRAPRSKERGGILVTTVIFCGLVGLMLVAYLGMLRSQQKYTYRSQVWNDCVAICEAGIEDAMAHINYDGRGNNFETDGWVLSGNAFRKERKFNTGGFVRTAISNGIPPIIIAEGYLQAPAQTTYIRRTFSVRTKVNYRHPY